MSNGTPFTKGKNSFRFTGFVRVPGAFIVRGHGGPHTTAAFDAVSEDGASVLGQGVLTL